jgi:hypothetical protein
MSRASRATPQVPCSLASRRSNLRSAYLRSEWNDTKIAVPWWNGGRSDCLSPCQATRIAEFSSLHGKGDDGVEAHFDLEGLNMLGIESPSGKTEICQFHVARRIDKEVLFRLVAQGELEAITFVGHTSGLRSRWI